MLERHADPAIWPRTAALLAILYTLIYIAPFYLNKTIRPSSRINRDAPYVIRARLQAAVFATIANTFIGTYVISTYGKVSLYDALRLMGYWPVSLADIARVLLLCFILFAGPLFETGIAEGQWREWVNGTFLRETLLPLTGLRNLVFAPLTEELIWRSQIIPLYLLATPYTQAVHSYKSIVFLTPLFFGLAHLHHLYEFRLTHRRVPILMAVARSLFQFGYTSLFGFFAAFVFLRTGNVWACILAHSFCNCMGLPRFWGRLKGVEPEPEVMGPPADSEGENVPGPVKTGGLGIGWTVAYYVILFAGALGFYQTIWTLTESRYALVEI